MSEKNESLEEKLAERRRREAAGESVSKPGRELVRLGVRVPPAVHARLREIAYATHRSVNGLVNRAIQDLLDQHGR